MRIRTQFVVTMLLFGLMLAAISASAIVTSQKVETASGQEHIAAGIARGASELGYLANDYVIYRESQQQERWRTRFASFSEDVSRLKIVTAEQEALVRNIQTNTRRLEDVFNSVVSVIGSASDGQAGAIDSALLQTSWSRMAVQSQTLVSDASRLSQLLDLNENQAQRMNTIVIMALIGIFLAYVFINYFVTQKRALRGLDRLQAGTAVIGAGDLDFRIDDRGKDEIGDLSRSVNRMTADLKNITASKLELEKEIEQRRKAEEQAVHQKSLQEGINRILEACLTCESEEQLGKFSLTVAEELTGSKFGFIDEIDGDGLLRAIAMSNPGWELCAMPDKETGHTRPIGKFKVNGLYGRIIQNGKSLLTNEPSAHAAAIGLPAGHPRLTAFLGVPLVSEGKTIGVLALANREGGYRPEDVRTAEELAPAFVEALMRKRAEAALRASEQRWATTLSSIGDAVIATDTEGRITYMNAVAEVLTGWSLREGQGRPSTEVFHIVDEKTHTPAESLVLKVLREGVVTGLANHTVLVRKDGAEIAIDDSGAPIRDETGAIRGVVLVFRDITERKKVEQLKDEFIGMVSHELKTPITVILGALSTAMDERVTAAQSRELLGDAVTHTGILSSLVDNLLELSRQQSGRLTVNTQPTDIGEITRGVLNRLQSRSFVHRLSCDTPRELSPAIADPLRVERIIYNLVENAIKYSPRGGNVRVFAGEGGGYLKVGVSDEGPGISPEDQRRLFQSFERLGAKVNGSIQGTGLGLRVCRILVEAQGGKIWVESDTGKGATFFFTLPAFQPQAAASRY